MKTMQLRELIIQTMREEIGNPNGTSRYGHLFFLPNENMSKKQKKKTEGLINLETLEQFSDEDLLIVYNMFQRQYNKQM